MVIHVTEAERIYVPDVDRFGDVKRTKVLGIEAVDCEIDGGLRKAYFGTMAKEKVVKKENGKNGLDQDFTVPSIDVFAEGRTVFTMAGVTAEDQVTCSVAWLGMDAVAKQPYLDAWDAVDKVDPASIAAFGTYMRNELLGA